MTAKAPWIQRAAISDSVLEKIYASDQDMYPAPLTYQRLKSWVDACPELSICFEAEPEGGGDRVAVGAVIVLPLVRLCWEDLLVGKIKEVEIDPLTMFAGEDEAEVGLHLFHIERFGAFKSSGRLARFAEFAMDEAREVALGKGRWNVLGHSALTATEAGSAMCKRMGFLPTGYEELFVSCDETAKDSPKIEMVCIYPGDEEQKKTRLQKQGGVISISEMVVRRSNMIFTGGNEGQSSSTRPVCLA